MTYVARDKSMDSSYANENRTGLLWSPSGFQPADSQLEQVDVLVTDEGTGRCSRDAGGRISSSWSIADAHN